MNPTIEGLSSTWDLRFVAMAYLIATWSKDPDAQVGAVIVSPSTRQFTAGYNGFVAGDDDHYMGISMQTKLDRTVHAEMNAVLNARRSVEGWTLYSTKFPCLACANAMIQAGVARVVAKIPDAGKWTDTQKQAGGTLTGMDVAVLTYSEGNE